jgi:TonB family protein
MLLILAKVTVFFVIALGLFYLSKRATAAMRHLLCVCALAGSLLIPFTALIPSRVSTAFAIRLAAVDTTAAGHAVARAASWSPSALILAFWALGSIALLIRLAIGHVQMTRLIRSATPLTADSLYIADVGVPVVCGLLRPCVLMPRAASEWPDWQFEAAVRHELTHVRRNDLWTILIARIACAVWWFHPLAWLLSARLHDAQESACDDAVLFSGFEPATYAEALLAVAKTSTHSTLLQGCSMTTQTNLKSRIARLLDGSIARSTSRRNLIRTTAAFAVVLAGFATVGLRNGSAQGAPDHVYTMAEGVAAPKVLYKEDPQYTEQARADKVAGTVLVTVVIGTDGLVHDINIVKGIGAGLDEKAIEALTKWHFQPGTLNGEPVAVRANIEINFRLQ